MGLITLSADMVLFGGINMQEISAEKSTFWISYYFFAIPPNRRRARIAGFWFLYSSSISD